MPPFRYSLNGSTIKTTPLLDKIRIAGETGYVAIELWHDDLDEHLRAGGTTAEVRRALADFGLEVPSYIFVKEWCDTTGDAHERAFDEIRRRLGIAAEVGALHAIAGPPHGPVDRDQAGRNYRKLVDVGLEYGVRPAMEYLGFAQDIRRIEDALDIMDRSGHPQATIVHDPFHVFRGGGDLASLSLVPANRIAISHFNDAPADPPRDQQRDPHRVFPGDGVVDLHRYVRLLAETGYDRWLSLELFRPDLWEQDPREVARTGLEKMRAIVES